MVMFGVFFVRYYVVLNVLFVKLRWNFLVLLVGVILVMILLIVRMCILFIF